METGCERGGSRRQTKRKNAAHLVQLRVSCARLFHTIAMGGVTARYNVAGGAVIAGGSLGARAGLAGNTIASRQGGKHADQRSQYEVV